jgi:DnaJ homolog subfamily C member 7
MHAGSFSSRLGERGDGKYGSRSPLYERQGEERSAPGLAVRLMQIAGEFELDRKREKQELDDQVSRWKLRAKEAEDREEALKVEVEQLKADLEAKTAELERQSKLAKIGGDTSSKQWSLLRYGLSDLYRLFSGLRVEVNPAETLDLLGAAATANAARLRKGDENTDPSASVPASGGGLLSRQIAIPDLSPGTSAVVLGGGSKTVQALLAVMKLSQSASKAVGSAVDKERWIHDARATLDGSVLVENEVDRCWSDLQQGGFSWLSNTLSVAPSMVSAAPAGLLSAAIRGDAMAIEEVLVGRAEDVALSITEQSPVMQGLLEAATRMACHGGHVPVVARLLQEGVSLLSRSQEDLLRQTPLHVAAWAGHDGVCKQLLKHASSESSRLSSAAAERLSSLPADDKEARDAATKDALLARGIVGRVLDAQDTMGRTALFLAASKGHATVCKLLLLQGADPAIPDEDGAFPEAAAEDEGHEDTLRVLQDSSVVFWNASVRANRLYSERRYNEAIGAYSIALDKASSAGLKTSRRDLATLHYNRARAAFRLGRHVAAVEDCNDALDKDASYRNAIAQRGECHMALYDFERAARDFQQLLDSDPSDRQWARRILEARKMRDLSHYDVLGLPREFTSSQLKRSYRAACLKWHPDKHTSSAEGGHRAHIVFRRVSQAYEILGDNYKRMVHDMEVRSHGGEPGWQGKSSGFEVWQAKEAEKEAERDAERVAAETDLRVFLAEQERFRKEAREKLRARAASGSPQRATKGEAEHGVVAETGTAWLMSRVSSGVPLSPQRVLLSSRTPSKAEVDTTAAVGLGMDRTPPGPPSTSPGSQPRSARSTTRPATIEAEEYLQRAEAREHARWKQQDVPHLPEAAVPPPPLPPTDDNVVVAAVTAAAAATSGFVPPKSDRMVPMAAGWRSPLSVHDDEDDDEEEQGGLDGFVHQLDALDAEIRAMMSTDAAVEEHDDSEASLDEFEDEFGQEDDDEEEEGEWNAALSMAGESPALHSTPRTLAAAQDAARRAFDG